MSFNFAAPTLRRYVARAVSQLRLAPDDLLRDATYRRLWTSILISSFGGQVTMLALPLTAAVLLHATPTQMGLLTAMEVVPFVLFSLPSGVWLDRVRKLPVYVIGESLLAVVVASVPLAWWLGWLSMIVAVHRRLRNRHRRHDRRQRGADRADAGRRARAAGRSACEECARVIVGRSCRSGCGRRIDQTGRCADGVVGRCGVARHLRCDLARHPGAGRRAAGGGAILAGDARRACLRCAAPTAGDDGVHRRRLADVPSRCAGRADLVCDAHARLVGRRRRIVLRRTRRRHDCRQHGRQSHLAPLGPGPDVGARRRDLWRSVGCSARSHRPRRSESRCSRRC